MVLPAGRLLSEAAPFRQPLPDDAPFRQLLPEAAPCQQVAFLAGSPAERQLSRTDFRFAPSPRSASLAGPPIHEDMVVHGLCGRVPDSAGKVYLPDCICPLDCCCSDRRKSVGPSAPIAYATSVSPPDEAAARQVRRYWMLDEAGALPICLHRE